jgi:transmembrane sensor
MSSSKSKSGINLGIRHEAAAWVARLDRGALSAQTLLQFREWLEVDERNLEEFERCVAVWEDLDELHAYRHLFAKPRRKLMAPRFVGPAIAAGLAMMVIGLWAVPRLVNDELPSFENAHLETAVGRIKSHPLEDGSSVKLNTDSALEVEYTEDFRRVRLQQGEAFFDVAPDPDRPFVVETPLGNVTAVGTSFLVRLDGGSANVTVQSGRVRITQNAASPRAATPATDETATVGPGQTAIIQVDDVAIRSLDPSSLFRQLAWRDGMLVFEGDPLHKVVAEFNRYARTKIIIADPALRDMRLGGYFPVGDTEGFLSSLEVSFGIRVERRPGGPIALHASGASDIATDLEVE